MFFQKKNQKSYLLQGSKCSGVLFMKQKSPLNVLYLWAWGTCGCRGHVGVGDMWVSGTSGCRGHVGVGDMCAGGPVGVGDMWVWGTCGCRGHVGVGDMRVLGTYGSGGHEGVGDLYSGGLVCLILETCLFLSCKFWEKVFSAFFRSNKNSLAT